MLTCFARCSLAYVYQELGDSHYDTAISLYSRVFTAYSSTLNVLDVDSKLVPDFNEVRRPALS